MSDFTFEIHNKNQMFSKLVIEPEANEIDLKEGDVITVRANGKSVHVGCDALKTGGGNFLVLFPEVADDFRVEVNGADFYDLL